MSKCLGSYDGQHLWSASISNYGGQRCVYCSALLPPKSNLGKTPDSDVPDYFEPVLAYRHWGLHKGRLSSPMGHDPVGGYGGWNPGECEAFCSVSNLPSTRCAFARSGCSCGFYAVYSPTHEYARETSYYGGVVFGVVAAYGRVRLGAHGLRASKAKVVALHLPPVSRWTGDFAAHMTLMETYGAEGTKFFKSRRNLIAAMNVEVPNDLMQKQGYSRNFG